MSEIMEERKREWKKQKRRRLVQLFVMIGIVFLLIFLYWRFL